MGGPSWGVVATVHEPPPLLAAFAAHYVSAGASHVRLFFDQPNPEAEALLARFPQVQITLADEAYYQSRYRMPKPDHIHRRQRFNATDAYVNAPVDWLLHADADEFIETDNLVDELAAQPDEINTLKLANSERVFLIQEKPTSIFAGLARLSMATRRARMIRLLGRETYLYTTNGLSAHNWGKSISRTGRGLQLGIHAPIRSNKVVGGAAQATICHFDGMTPFHFVLKLVRYAKTTIYNHKSAKGKNRVMQLNYATACNFDLARLKDLHGLVSGITNARIAPLLAFGYLRNVGKSPVTASYQHFSPDELDLSLAAFDRALAARSDESAKLYETWLELGL